MLFQIVRYSGQWILGSQYHFHEIYQQFCSKAYQNSRKLQFNPFTIGNITQNAEIVKQ